MSNGFQSSALEQRIEKLERQTNILKLLLVGIPALMLLLGAEAAQRPASEPVVKAEKFVLINSNGEERGALFTVDDIGRLALLDDQGVQRVELRANSRTPNDHQGAHLQLSSESGKPVVTAGRADQNGIGYVDFYDGNDNFQVGVGGGR